MLGYLRVREVIVNMHGEAAVRYEKWRKLKKQCVIITIGDSTTMEVYKSLYQYTIPRSRARYIVIPEIKFNNNYLHITRNCEGVSIQIVSVYIG